MYPIVARDCLRVASLASLLALAMSSWMTSSVVGQVSAALSQNLVPNARAQGMGRAFSALAEGPAAAWWNPGSLALQNTIAINPLSLSKLVPDLADDVWLYNYGGAAAFGPIGVGAQLSYLSYGESQALDEMGSSSVDSSDMTVLFGGGVDLMEIIDPESGGRLQLGLGANLKFIKVDLAPGWIAWDDYSGAGDAWDIDFGSLGRLVTPLDDGYVELSGAWVMKNALDNEIEFVDQDERIRLGRSDRLGLAVSGALVEQSPFGHLLKGTLAADAVGVLFTPHDEESTIYHLGVEGSVLGLLAVRFGYIDDEDGDIHDLTFGFGVGADIHPESPGSQPRRIGARFDFASVPQAADLDRVLHFGLSGWIGFN